MEPHDHVVHFYESDAELVESVGRYFADGMAQDASIVVIATPSHAAALELHLQSEGIDVAAAKSAGAYVVLDAAETLQSFMVASRPDPVDFDDVVGGVLRSLPAGRPIRAYGEMVALLWDSGEVNGAIALERLWNELSTRVPFSLYCSYPAGSVQGELVAEHVSEIERQHSNVVGSSTPEAWTDHAATDDVTRAFTQSLEAPRRAREFVVETLERWGRADLVDDARLVVSELATNAVLHAGCDFTVSVTSRRDCVRVTVRDDSLVAPYERAAALNTSGRGLHLVAATARRWGTEVLDDGKAVWAELA